MESDSWRQSSDCNQIGCLHEIVGSFYCLSIINVNAKWKRIASKQIKRKEQTNMNIRENQKIRGTAVALLISNTRICGVLSGCGKKSSNNRYTKRCNKRSKSTSSARKEWSHQAKERGAGITATIKDVEVLMELSSRKWKQLGLQIL